MTTRKRKESPRGPRAKPTRDAPLGTRRSAKAESFVVPGFPEVVKYERRCRLCCLTKDEPGLGRLVHDLYLANQATEEPSAKIIEKANLLLERHGIRGVDKRAFDRHFEAHVSLSDMVKSVAEGFQDFTVPDDQTLDAMMDSDEHALLEVTLKRGAFGSGENDYQQMYRLFQRINRRIAAIDADPTAFLGADGEHSNYGKLMMWTKLVSEARSLLEGLNKMRNQDRLVLNILEGHTKKFAVILADAIKLEVGRLLDGAELPAVPRETWARDDYERAADSALTIVAGLRRFLDERAATMFQTAAYDSLQQSKTEFNLH